VTQDANPGPEDCDPLDEGGGQQSKGDGPTPEDDDPPDESEGQKSRRIEPGPVDDDPPPPQKRPQASALFGSLRHMLARFFHRP
jgi:hypothetical protein